MCATLLREEKLPVPARHRQPRGLIRLPRVQVVVHSRGNVATADATMRRLFVIALLCGGYVNAQSAMARACRRSDDNCGKRLDDFERGIRRSG